LTQDSQFTWSNTPGWWFSAMLRCGIRATKCNVFNDLALAGGLHYARQVAIHMRLPVLAAGFLVISLMASGQQAPPPQGPPNDAGQDAAGPPDEPGRAVARISVLSGDASVRRGDSGDWVAAALNAPLMVGDSVSVAAGGAVEVQLDAANFARLAGDSEIRISEFEAGRYQVQLAKGLVTYRVLRQSNAQVEISTPLAAVRPLGLASVRVETAPDGSTRVVVRHGDVEVNTKHGAERVHEGNVMQIQGSPDDPEFQTVSAPIPDQWDNWSDQRDAYLQRAQSPRYVSQDIYGTEDMDNYGRWNNDPAYGDVWTPTVPAGWAPYRDGRWVWEDYYGWTWVDASPWGWAPFHYGSWYNRPGFGWSWFPGHRYEHYWYRPALVGFFGFGGGSFGVGFGFGNIGWIPLAPFERFHPWYGRGGWGGRVGGFNSVNIVRNTNITSVYRNSRFANGVSAVSGADFQRGNFRNQVAVGGAQLQGASLVRGAVPVTPGGDHLRFSDRVQAGGGPRVDAGNQRFFTRMPASAASSQRVPFTQQQSAVRSAFESRGIQTHSGSAGTDAGRRFGGTTAGTTGAASTGGNSSPGWQRFGSPQAGASRSNPAPQANGSAGERFGGQSRSLQVAPPIVRERQSAPSGGGSSFGNRAPAYQPQRQYGGASAPSGNSAPRYQSGNSGGFGAPVNRQAPSAPAYRPAPSSRPSQSAPAPRNSGGGGGGGSHAGGGNSGGHSSRR
jgi:hypothetical protein